MNDDQFSAMLAIIVPPIEYSGAAKPPVRLTGNHLSGLRETARDHMRQSRQHSPGELCRQ